MGPSPNYSHISLNLFFFFKFLTSTSQRKSTEIAGDLAEL